MGDDNRFLLKVTILILSFVYTNGKTHFHPKVHLSPNYSIHEAPIYTENVPIDVNFTINLRNILEVNEVAQLISMETSIRMFWIDYRVRAELEEDKEYLTLNPKAAEHFWIPDIFIDRSKNVRVPTYHVKPASLRIYNDKKLRYSSRINFDVACSMDFHKFPVDEQLCEINFESFGHTNKQLKFKWVNGSNINPNITLAQFSMEVSLEDTYDTSYYDLSYPGIIMKIRLQRQLGYHIVQTYIPSIVFVTLSWLALFVSPESIPGRIGMGMTTLLTLTAMFGATRQNVPKVSYISYLDIWMVTCIIFVFGSMIEFTVIHSLIRINQKPRAERVERLMRIVIPVLFVVFNIIYWTVLATS